MTDRTYYSQSKHGKEALSLEERLKEEMSRPKRYGPGDSLDRVLNKGQSHERRTVDPDVNE